MQRKPAWFRGRARRYMQLKIQKLDKKIIKTHVRDIKILADVDPETVSQTRAVVRKSSMGMLGPSANPVSRNS
jgi:hypothetical protein